MRKWTKEQTEAYQLSGCNIIVSAGAGSGKTAVLTERVIEKVRNGVSVRNLLILTFTRDAAQEMKNRIRKALSKNSEFKSELDALDSAYITTFDSFALSLVKKYHYVLNIPKDISITPESIITLYTKKTLDEIFLEKYQEKDSEFLKIITDFCVKNDDIIKKQLLSINTNLNKKVNKISYLEEILDKPFTDEKISDFIKRYEEMVIDKAKNLEPEFDGLINEASGAIASNITEIKEKLNSCVKVKDVLDVLNISLPTKNKDCSEKYSKLKDDLNKEKKKIIKLGSYLSREDYVSDIERIVPTIKSVVSILIELEKRVIEYKKKYNLYTFYDIAKLAISLVSDNESVRKEVSGIYQEIMVDEYQDTSDIQESLISLISNNNVYMVGDIKQSIYRFRNANLLLFKSKYDSFTSSKIKNYDDKGIRIDLLDNFRSRDEVIKGINRIFSIIMNEKVGGAKYKEEHLMNAGNKAYDSYTDENFKVEVLNYHKLTNKKYDSFTKAEKEAFLVASDIKKKINGKYTVYDKEKDIFRECKYSDFVLLVNKAGDFNTYRNVFEYMNIPMCVNKDESLLSGYNLLIIKNIMKYINKIAKNEYDTEYNYLFMSIARSFLFSYSDELIITMIREKKTNESDIYLISKEISSSINSLSNVNLIENIFKMFGFLNKIPSVGEADKLLSEIKYIIDLGEALNKADIFIEDYINLIEDIIESKLKLDYPVSIGDTDAVNLMTIHKSKGLEFPICYFLGLSNTFNFQDIKDTFLYSDKIGIFTPYFDFGIKETFLKELLKHEYTKDDISERIRLFYVALTRAREKIIIVDNLEDDVKEIKPYQNYLRYNSFKSFMNSVYYYLDCDINTIEPKDITLTKDYKISKTPSGVEKGEKVETVDLSSYLPETEKSSAKTHYSKTISSLTTEEEKEKMELGTKVHYLLQILNIKELSKDYVEALDIASNEKKILYNLMRAPFYEDIKKGKLYKEHEFVTEKTRGVIDLLIETDSSYIIVDYKLSNIDDPAYVKQVNGYMEYVSSLNKEKKVYGYLFSLIKGTVKSCN